MPCLLSMLPQEYPSIMTYYILSDNHSALKCEFEKPMLSNRFVKITMDTNKIMSGKENEYGERAAITRLYPQRSGQIVRTVQEPSQQQIIHHPTWWHLLCPTTGKWHAAHPFIHEQRICQATKCKLRHLGQAVYANLFKKGIRSSLCESWLNLGISSNKVCAVGDGRRWKDSSNGEVRGRRWWHQEWSS